MNILLFGGAGYLGSMLSKRLLNNKHNVTVIDNLRFKQGYYVSDILTHPNCNFKNIDIMETPDEDFKKADVVFNLAALVGPICDKYPLEAQQTNVEAVKWMVPKIGKYQKYCFLCSSSGYGIANKVCTEQDEMKSISLYAKTKEEAEKIVINEVKNATSFRLATVYGASLYHRLDLLVNDLTWQAVKYGKLSLFQGNYKRTYIEITNVIDILDGWKYDQRMNGQIYNAASDNFTKSELVDKIKQFIPDLKVEYSNEEDKDCRSYFLDTTKIEKLGFICKKNLDNSLKDLIKFYNLIDVDQDNLNRMRDYDNNKPLLKYDTSQGPLEKLTFVESTLD